MTSVPDTLKFQCPRGYNILNKSMYCLLVTLSCAWVNSTISFILNPSSKYFDIVSAGVLFLGGLFLSLGLVLFLQGALLVNQSKRLNPDDKAALTTQYLGLSSLSVLCALAVLGALVLAVTPLRSSGSIASLMPPIFVLSAFAAMFRIMAIQGLSDKG